MQINQPKFKYDLMLEDILIDSLDGEDTTPFETNEEGFKHLFERYYHEVGKWQERSMTRIQSIRHWLQGLAINIPIYNNDIIELAKKYNYQQSDSADEALIDSYWNALAIQFFNLTRKIMNEVNLSPEKTSINSQVQ